MVHSSIIIDLVDLIPEKYLSSCTVIPAEFFDLPEAFSFSGLSLSVLSVLLFKWFRPLVTE